MIYQAQNLRESSASSAPRDTSEIFTRFRDYLTLTKPEINALILISTVAGGWLAFEATGASFSLPALTGAVFGTALVASGAGALNQVLEKRFDALMNRTRRRPVAAERIPVFYAAMFGSLLALSGILWLLVYVNVRAALLALFAIGTYILAYTPLKRRSPACIFVGALAGAIPPLIGWVACSGSLNLEAALIFTMLFLWQLPHFMSIGWLCRDQYDSAGYRVIPNGRSRDVFIAIATILPALGLLAVSLIPALMRGNLIYVAAICFIGLAFLFFGIRLVIRKTNSAARQLLAASIYYLSFVFALLILVESYRPPIH
jgi:protoheme IX farnesyltransferase